jgi:general secretion pathway protein E
VILLTKEELEMPYQSLDQRLGETLVQNLGLRSEDLEEALRIHQQSKRRLGDILIEKRLVKPEDVAKAVSLQMGIPYVEDLKPEEIDPKMVAGLTIHYCREHAVLPLSMNEDRVRVAIVDPLDYATLDSLRLHFKASVEPVLTTPAKLETAINEVFERSENMIRGLEDEKEDLDISLSETIDLLESSDDEAPVIRFVNSLLFQAVKEKASDIHIEPFEKNVIVRFRIDGILYDKYTAPKRLHAAIASRIKVMAELNIAEKRIPQDGRVKVKLANREIDIRLSVLPVVHGERLVMRLLDKSSVVLDLAALGFEKEIRDTINELTNRKYGIFLVTGPTGSGKSTTLSACLKNILSPDKNIITVEDPVEYNLPGVGQIAVNPKVGLTFASGLRAILRQDPDVVMVGEIRDRETAEIAINASLTGHLVLSTLHTNDAPGAITRLIDMGVESFLVSSSIVGVLAQRLLRVVCKNCSYDYEPSDEQLRLAGIDREYLMQTFNIDKIRFKKPRGCHECRQTGYQGRTAIHELMVVTDAIKAHILNEDDASSIRRTATKEGLKTLRFSALEKLVHGQTSLEEIIRTTQLES